MLLHLAFAGSSGAKKAVVVSPDTDVFVLLIHHYINLKVDNIFFKTGRTFNQHQIHSSSYSTQCLTSRRKSNFIGSLLYNRL